MAQVGSRPEQVRVPRSMEELDALISQLGHIDAELLEIEHQVAAVEGPLKKIIKEIEKQLAEAREILAHPDNNLRRAEIGTILAACAAFCQVVKDEMDRRHKFESGNRVDWVLGNRRTVIEDETAAVAEIQALGLGSLFLNQPTINKAAILAAEVEVVGKLATISIVRDDKLTITPFITGRPHEAFKAADEG